MFFTKATGLSALQVRSTSWEKALPSLSQYYKEKGIILDSFLEDFIRDGNHYCILDGKESIGWFVIHGESTLVTFALSPLYGHISQEIFAQIIKFERVTEALLPTGDEFFLSHVLDRYRALSMQAYFSLYKPPTPALQQEMIPIVLEQAAPSTHSEEIALAGDFFFPKLAKQEQGIEELSLYLAYFEEDLVGFGNIESSRLTDFASTGMMVLPEYRKQGLAKSILFSLNEKVRKQGKIPISGCWYYNHNSKKTMEAAGGYSPTRLLRFSF